MKIQKAENIERFSVVKMENGKIGMFERKTLNVLKVENKEFVNSYKVRRDTYLEVIKYPATLAVEYITNNEIKDKKRLDLLEKERLENEKQAKTEAQSVNQARELIKVLTKERNDLNLETEEGRKRLEILNKFTISIFTYINFINNHII